MKVGSIKQPALASHERWSRSGLSLKIPSDRQDSREVYRNGKLPEPHSAAWFRRMRQINPEQAAFTAQIVELAGTPCCCGICGDTEKVRDYRPVSILI